MNRPHGTSTRFAALVLAGGLALGACSGSSSGSGGGAEGEISVSGSSTVEPISVRVGELFAEVGGTLPSVEGPGTGDGFKKFCAGETDISDASRAIKDEEQAICEQAGVTYTELQIANDAITVLTNENNDSIDCLTFEDLYGLVGPESEGVNNWSEAAAKGATSSLPDAPLEIFAPGTESGTYDSFFELAIEDIAADKGAPEDVQIRPDYGGLANDNEIVSGLQSVDSSFGWVGFAFAEEAEGVRELEIDGGEGCVAPSAETVADGTYPLARPLFIYVNNEKLAENAALSDFVDFYVSDEGMVAVPEVGYVALDDADLEATRSTWASAKP
ncbi:MAG: substrate-binding domain-containing protein [Microthrixaceae bacterium]